jgi:hypothetical protein
VSALIINPNQNISEQFSAPLAGNVEVMFSVQPEVGFNFIWTNLTYSVLYYDYGYSLSPKPYLIQLVLIILKRNFQSFHLHKHGLIQTWGSQLETTGLHL